MIRIILILFLSFPVALCAQTYQQLSEKAIEYIEMDSLSKAEELLLQALKLEPKNAKNGRAAGGPDERSRCRGKGRRGRLGAVEKQ